MFAEVVAAVHTRSQESRELMGMATTGIALVGHPIVEEGTVSDAFFVVLSGQCSVYKGPELLATIDRGGHFGELGLIDADQRSADVIAASSVECMAMSRDDLFGLFRDDRDLANKILMALLTNLAGRVRSLSTTVQRLGDLLHEEKNN